ncbi:S1 RNA-binding domain-containing protein [Streptomyces seoulensis]
MIGPSESPDLWAFLGSLNYDDLLTGTVAAIEPYGVFVALDDGPPHPLFPGVGFITYPELSWHTFDDASEVVRVGQRVSCRFLQFDTTNGEARLSLRGTQPDPFQAFANRTAVGQQLTGRIKKLLPFGVIVEVADGIEAVVHRNVLATDGRECTTRVGAPLTLEVTAIDRARRTISLSHRPPGV